MSVSAPRSLPIMVAICLLLGGCASAPSRQLPPPEATLTNTYWKLERVAGQQVPDRGPRGQPHLIFQDDGQVRGHTGCNVLKGAYGPEDGRLRFLAMGATRMACPGETVEGAFVAAMHRTRNLVIEENRLSMKAADGRTLAELVAPRSR